MANASGFWSYVHNDDDASGGRISQLARDIVAEYEMQTADVIDLFLDRDVIDWGEAWKDRIDISLASVAFFVPVVTPRFFKSVECRRELKSFADRARALGVRELIMPILYVDVPDLRVPQERDEAMDIITEFQWEDLTELRHEARDSSEYRKAVARMAARIVKANEIADGVEIQADAFMPDSGGEDTSGTFEMLAKMEETMPEWTETMAAASSHIEEIGRIVGETDYGPSNPAMASFVGRLNILRNLSARLIEPGKSLLADGQTFSRQLGDVDLGMGVLIKQLSEEARQSEGPNPEIEEFVETIRSLERESEQALGQIDDFVKTLGPIQAMSRDMKPPIGDMRSGLTMMVEGKAVIRGWVEQMNDAGLGTGEAVKPKQ